MIIHGMFLGWRLEVVKKIPEGVEEHQIEISGHGIVSEELDLFQRIAKKWTEDIGKLGTQKKVPGQPGEEGLSGDPW